MSSNYQNIFTTFSQALRYALEKKRFSQRELAEKLDIGDSQISRWLSGEVTPYVRTQKKIASALQVRFDKDSDGYAVIDLADSQNHVNEPKVVYADEVELPEDGKLSRDQMKELLGQIEVISRILKDSL